MPSSYEGFGLSLIEAMAAGKLVIANNIPVFKNIISHSRNGFLINFSDTKKAAETIYSIIKLDIEKKKDISKEVSTDRTVEIASTLGAKVYKNRWVNHATQFNWALGWMDEHIKITKGKTAKFKGDIIDHNLNNLSWYIDKYNKYTTREAIDILNLKYKIFKYDEIPKRLFGTQEERKRFLKEKIYAKSPLFLRALKAFYFMHSKVSFIGL